MEAPGGCRAFEMKSLTRNIGMEASQANDLGHGSQGDGGQCLKTFSSSQLWGRGSSGI